MEELNDQVDGFDGLGAFHVDTARIQVDAPGLHRSYTPLSIPIREQNDGEVI